jgi:5-oxoprolinase (ATP-hydrolysing) subunit A
VDLNADVGEGYGVWRLGDDEALLDLVTSANVACGFHAGDPSTIERTVAAAAARRVVIGAQVSYPDLAGFGRRAMDIPADELRACVLYQLGALEAFARSCADRIRYVKPHGALYHRTAHDRDQARAVVDAVRRYDPSLAVLTMPGSTLSDLAAEAGLTVVAEGYVDRAYADEDTLVPRSIPGALLTDPAAAAAQALALAGSGRVASLCVHSDTPGALDIARAVRAALAEANLPVQSFAP